ncbi:hypothetical protein DL96DRAFT_1560783 [Flagelloscypha sp. PMI_526]|nr:hypothetical protein DL96DRAFT_1560783 [Flagelloscypha sp. PMI_526]
MPSKYSLKYPPEAKGVMAAAYVHTNLFCGIFNEKMAPAAITNNDLNNFTNFFAGRDPEQLINLPAGAAEHTNVKKHVNTLQRCAREFNTRNTKLMGLVEEDHLLAMYAYPLYFGFPEFRVDIRPGSSPTSGFNVVARTIWIQSFRQNVRAGAYHKIAPVDMRYVDSTPWLQRIFLHIFFFRYRARFAALMKDQEALINSTKLRAAYKRRSDLAVRRHAVAKELGVSRKPFLRLYDDPDAMSDCEVAIGTYGEEGVQMKISYTYDVYGRCEIASGMASCISASGREFALLTQRGNTTIPNPRVRKNPQGPVERRRLPIKVPIDYFSPEFFNNLPFHIRAKYRCNGIAMPIAEHCEDLAVVRRWLKMGEDEFMQNYGNAKLALYQVPTEEEVAAHSANAEEEGEEYDDLDV